MLGNTSRLFGFSAAGLWIVSFFFMGACTKTYPSPLGDCSTSANCPESTSPCSVAKCVSGRCVELPSEAKTSIEDSVVGDCHRSECDGEGNMVSIVDDLDLPADSECMFGTCMAGTIGFQPRAKGFIVTAEPIGDCQRIECDGTDTPVAVNDDTDIPVNIGTCYMATCTAGVPSQSPIPQGTSIADPIPGDCQQIVCDGMGNETSTANNTDTPDDMNVCTNDVCIQGVPTHEPKPAGMLMDNGVVGDCLSAQCDGMGNMVVAPNNADVPSDNATCTIDSCSSGMPVHTPKPTGTSCGSNNAVCHPDGRCDSCADPGANCPDNGFGEPNETQATAKNFGNISDADSAGQTFCGILSGPGDVDWYTYQGKDDLFSEVDPFQSISNGTKGQLCAFFKCQSGTTSVSCGANAKIASAPGGQSGCCSTSPFPVTLECSSVDDNAQVWLRIDNPDANACIPYQVTFHY